MKRTALGVSALVACGALDSAPIGEVPSQPSGPETTSTDVSTFAIDALFVGDTDFSGTPSKDAWRAFGYDLDGLDTMKTSTNVCTRPGGTSATFAEGLGGIDNAWASEFLPYTVVVKGGGFFGPTDNGSLFAWVSPSTDATSFIRQGAWTLEIMVKGLPSHQAQDATGLDAQVFVGSAQKGATFDPNTAWPVAPSSLADGQTIAGGARLHFATTYVHGNTVVARDASEPLIVPMVIDNAGPQICMLGNCSDPRSVAVPVPFTLRIHHPILTFVRGDASITHGIIAGILDPKELTDAVVLAWDLGAGGCEPSLRPVMDDNTMSMTDILHDETNGSGLRCDAMSIGLGFTAKRIANPTTIGADTTTPPDPCAN